MLATLPQTAIAIPSRVRELIAETDSIDDAAGANHATLAAIKAAAKQFDRDVARSVHEAWLLWVAHVGRLLQRVPRNRIGRPNGNSEVGSEFLEACALRGITERQAHTWQRLGATDDSVIEAYFHQCRDADEMPTMAGLIRERTTADRCKSEHEDEWTMAKAGRDLLAKVKDSIRKWPDDDMNTFLKSMEMLIEETPGHWECLRDDD